MEKESFTQPDTVISDQQSRVLALVGPLIDACPDMRQMARETAQSILQKHTGLNLEPDNVYWHRFSNAQGSARTFTGWEHVGPPVQSLSLPQLVMQRYNPADNEATDELQQLGGFYTADAGTRLFNEKNEVPMFPRDVLDDLWAIDFSSQFYAKLDVFWNERLDDFRALAKANFIAHAFEDQTAGFLTVTDVNMLMRAIGVNLAQPMTLDVLKARAHIPSDLQICTFDVVGYEASDILRFVLPGGRQILYTAGEVQGFHPFDNPHDLHWWLMSQNTHKDNRARFMEHFGLGSHGENGDNIGLHNALDLLFSTWGTTEPTVINRKSRALTDDAFDHLAAATKERMYADAHYSLHSNADLRKQIWTGYLGVTAEVTGPLAALYWPIALAAVGAGIAQTGLNIDHAVTGHTTAERKEGVKGAIVSAINTLFNSTFLIHTGGELPKIEPGIEPEITPIADEQSAPVKTPSLEELAPGRTYPAARHNLLSPFETNVLLDGYEPVREAGRLQGIYVLEDGSTYIQIADVPYAVRYINELNTWAIVDPENPFSFFRNMPVRRTASGLWEPMTTQGLRGGGKVFGKMPWGRSASAQPVVKAAATPYDMPEQMRPALRDAAQDSHNKETAGYLNIDKDPAPIAFFDATRKQLRLDAQAFYDHFQVPARPQIPAPAAGASSKVVLKDIFDKATGLVVGESHASMDSKQFLIDNMPRLSKLKVKTLYFEHLMTDFHQADLDAFSRTGKMSEQLESYIKRLDAGHRTDPSGKYTFMGVIKAAYENHIRIQAIDCMASYRLKGLGGNTKGLRVRIMNFFAHTVIQTNQANTAGAKWVALVGSAHASTFKGVPGVAELEGAISLRVEESPTGTAPGFDRDPGQQLRAGQVSSDVATVKSDLRLRAPNSTLRSSLAIPEASLEARLSKVGDFTFINTDRGPEIVHRSNSGELVHTPIQDEQNKLFITKPSWATISGKRFDSFSTLTLALQSMGLREKV